jgi:NAD(P)-dependent dehydrogenase (short-subunit alcohol dehydrogenase family)
MMASGGTMYDLNGKNAVITGGNSGIGLATAKEFIAQGAKVVISGRDADTLERTRKELGPEALVVRADVRKLDDLEQLFAAAKAHFGPVDAVFVNAGIARMGEIGAVTETDFDEVINANFKGAFFTIQKALPVMRDGGAFVLNGSVNAHVGFAGASVYSASKAALHSLARTLAPELIVRGIRINTITIGPIETPLFSKIGLPELALQGFAQALSAKIPLKRFGKPEEIARIAAFLASDASSLMTGSEVTADGGLSVNAL